MLRDERGLTLVEILVALVVISVGLVGIAVVVPVSSEAIQHGGQLSRATFLAEQTIEQARTATWTADARRRLPRRLDGGDAAGTRPAPDATAPRPRGFPTSRRWAATPPIAASSASSTAAPAPCAGVTDAALRLVTVVVTYRTPGVAR